MGLGRERQLTRLGVRAEVVRAAVLAHFRTADVVAVTVVPRCPRCDAAVPENLRTARVTVDGHPVRVAYCGICGAVVPVTFGP